MNKQSIILGITIAGLSTLGVIAILVLSFSHSTAGNSDQAMLQIVAILTPTLIALIGAFKSIETEKSVTTKVIDLKSSIDGNTVKVADLNNKVETAKTVADVAAKTAVLLADKVEQLNGK